MTVSAQPAAIDPSQTSVSSAVDKERIEELPVQSRNYLNFALLAPGVSSSAQQPGKRSLAALPDSGFTFGGLRGRSNNVSIDGLDNNDEYVGSSRTELSLETVQVLLDPLIPGRAPIVIQVPDDPGSYPTLREHLCARVTPAGLLGTAGGNRVETLQVNNRGAAAGFLEMNWLETWATIQLYDATQPYHIIDSSTVYISPFCRRQLVTKTILFNVKGEK